VDRTYRTRPEPENTGVVGASFGGNVSLWLGLEHPEVFRRVGCLSPAAWWGSEDLRRRAATMPAGLRIWLDVGTAEGEHAEWMRETVETIRSLRDALRRHPRENRPELHYEELDGARHETPAWAARLDRMLVFLVGRPEG